MSERLKDIDNALLHLRHATSGNSLRQKVEDLANYINWLEAELEKVEEENERLKEAIKKWNELYTDKHF